MSTSIPVPSNSVRRHIHFHSVEYVHIILSGLVTRKFTIEIPSGNQVRAAFAVGWEGGGIPPITDISPPP